MPDTEERQDQLGRIITFRVPEWMYRSIEVEAGRELLCVSAFVRRGVLQSLALSAPEGL